MRHWMAVLLLAAAVLAPQGARAGAVVEELLVRRQGANVNIRVTLRNPGPARQPGPVVIDLFVRPDASSPWQRIKTWNNIKFIQPGYKVSRDFFEENNALLAGLAARGHFEVRASVRAPGLARAAEKTSVYDTETGR